LMANPAAGSIERYYERLTLNQRAQHWALIVSFTTLVLTGLPVRYPEAPLSSVAVQVVGGFAIRTLLHRIAAVILIGLTGYHILYTLFSPRGRSEMLALMPNFKDLIDAIKMSLFYIGLYPKPPKFDRYNFIEKFEYLAVGWGSVVMIGTGLALWFQDEAMTYLPKWTLDVARIIHSYEGLLAFLAIIIWHFYHVHLNPEVFPMSRIWLNGKISEHDLMEHHPLEYERIKEREAKAAALAARAEPVGGPDDDFAGGTDD
jgi:formate dehydrogenase subunit gamma